MELRVHNEELEKLEAIPGMHGVTVKAFLMRLKQGDNPCTEFPDLVVPDDAPTPIKNAVAGNLGSTYRCTVTYGSDDTFGTWLQWYENKKHGIIIVFTVKHPIDL